MTTKVFQYGALPPIREGSIRAQMLLARQYYNALVEAENARRVKVWGGEEPPDPLHPPEIYIEEETGRKRKKWCHCAECRAHTRALVARYDAEPALDLKPLRARAVEAGLYWGSYLLAEEAFSAAWKKTHCWKRVKFRSWRDGGEIGVQVATKNKHPERMYIFQHADDPREGRRAGQRKTLQLRVGSEGRAPLWSDPLRLEMHRPIRGRVTWVSIHLQYRGDREIWSVNVTCADVPEREDLSDAGVVAIDVSWRTLPSGDLRIAYARGSDGKEHELLLSPEWYELGARADRIRGHRDGALDVLQIKYPALEKLRKPRNVRPYILKHEMMNEELEQWCRRDRHLEQYELGCRRRSVAIRIDSARKWLRELRRAYGYVVIKDTKHKEIKDHEKAVDDGVTKHARRNAHHGAPGWMIEEITKVWRRNIEVAVVLAPYTTAECACGHIVEVGPELVVHCEQCCAAEDRDRVSTRNMLHRYDIGDIVKPKARKTRARFAKRHKK